MTENEDVIKQMDEAANQAKTELLQHFNTWSAQDIAIWWTNWYQKTGHKRLGRILITMSNKSNNTLTLT